MKCPECVGARNVAYLIGPAHGLEPAQRTSEVAAY